MPRTRIRTGMTLIELLIVLSIIGILAAVAMPRLNKALANERMRSAKTSMATLVVAARASAVQHGGVGRFRLQGSKAWAEGGPAGGMITVTDTVNFDSRYKVTVSPDTARVDYGGRGLAIGGPAAGLALVFTGETGRTDTLCVTQLGVLLRRGCGA